MRASAAFDQESPIWQQSLGHELDPEIIGTEDTRRCVTNTAAMPFRFIASLEVGNPCCTGTMIGPRTVLTAGHCLVTHCLRPGLAPSAMRAIPARNGFAATAEPFGASALAGLQLAPGFVGASATDVGIAILQNPVGNSSGWWTFDPFATTGDPLGTSIISADKQIPNASVELHIAGYPCDHPKATHLGGVPDRCFRAGVRRGSVLYHDRNGLAAIPAAGILEYFNDTFACMSGSPVWVQRTSGSGGRTMLAVHISRDRPPNPVANRGVLITGRIRDFIRAHSFTPPGSTPPGRPTVRMGARGSTVEELQYRLNIFILTAPGVGIARLQVDGIFGPKTLTAVRAFQRRMSLTVDGVVGPQTWRRLQLPF